MEVEDYSTNAENLLSAAGADAGDAPTAQSEAGTLAYYAPWGDVVMFYDAYSPNASLYELGQAVSGGELVGQMTGDSYDRYRRVRHETGVNVSGKKEWKKIVIQTGKIAVGSSAAIYIAQTLGLENAASAGTITLLTIVTTKWETLKLSAYRLITFAVSVLLAAMTIGCLESVWIAYAVYIFAVIFICQMFGWQATISVNSVIGIHFLTSKDFSLSFIFNEFLLVFIGITIAVLLNLFHDYKSQEDKLIQSMRDTEKNVCR